MAVPSGGHGDWLFGLFKWIPRKATAIPGPPPTDVKYSDNFDHVNKHPDIPNDGAWALSTHPKYGFCFATVVDGWLFSVGTFRYDYADGYYELGRFAFHGAK